MTQAGCNGVMNEQLAAMAIMMAKQEAMEERGLTCHVTAPGLSSEDPYGSLEAFLIASVKGE